MSKILSVPLINKCVRFFTRYGHIIITALMVHVLSVTMVFFPLTAFWLDSKKWVVLCSCALFSAVTVYFFFLRLRRIMFIGAGALIGVCAFLFRRVIILQIKTAAEVIGQFISYWNDDPVLHLPEERNVTLLAVFFSAVCVLLFSYILVGRKSLWWSLIIIAPVCTLCYSISAPSDICSFSLVVCAAILIMTQRARQRSAWNGARLTAALALPVAVIFAVICAIFPSSGYNDMKLPYSLKYNLQDIGWDMIDLVDGGASSSGNEFSRPGYDGVTQSGLSEWTDLTELGALRLSTDKVMSVYSETSGTMYLRGMTYSLYEDGVWSSCTAQGISDLHFMSGGDIANARNVTIKTIGAHSVLYTPYYSTAISVPTALYGDAYLENTENADRYSVAFETEPESFTDNSYMSFVYSNCLYLEQDLQDELYRIANEANLTTFPSDQLVSAVRHYISNAAEYDLSPLYPPEESDPIVWFLTEGQRGYCVHFASACAAMLRALGVPARMVTGYYIPVEEGWNDVRGLNAHAWTEYYDRYSGWIPIDATGSSYQLEQMVQLPEDQQPESDEQPTEQPEEEPLVFQDAQPAGVPRTGKESESVQEELTYTTEPPELPEQADNKAQEQSENAARAPIYIAIFIVCLAGSLFGVNFALDRLRDRAMKQGSAEQRAVACWKYALRLCQARGAQPDKAMRRLVMKAQYARNSATEDELAELYGYVLDCRSALRKSDRILDMLVHRFVRFLY